MDQERSLTQKDVQDYWMGKCGQTRCRVCGTDDPPTVAGVVDDPSYEAVVLATEGGFVTLHGLKLICPECGLMTELAADRVAYWKKTGE